MNSERFQPSLLAVGAAVSVGVALLLLLMVSPLITLASLGLIILVLLMAWQPRWGLYLMCLTLPVIGWEFTIQGLYFTLVDLLGLAMVFGLGIRAIWTRLFGGQPQTLRLPFFGYFILFFTSIVLSDVFSGDALPALWYAARVIVFFYVAYMVVPASLVERKSTLRTAIACIAFSGLFVAGSSLVTLVGQYLDADFFRVRGVRLFGIFPFGVNHNLIAEYLIMTNFFLLSLRYWIKPLAGRRAVNILFIAITIIALATFSRAAWIAALIQFAVFFALKKTDKIKLVISSCILIVLLTPLAFKMVSLQENNYSSTASRLLLSKIAWESFLHRPLIGYGTGSFIHLVGDNIRFTAQYGDPMDSHGIWQKVIAEQGAFGLIAFGLISVTIFRRLFKRYSAGEHFQEMLLPLIVGSLGTFIFQFFNTSYYKGKLWVPIALTLAAAWLTDRTAVDRKHEETEIV